jgi:hypothetical protein
VIRYGGIGGEPPGVLCEWAFFYSSVAQAGEGQFLSAITGIVNRKTLP